ncbi:MAG: Trm112 family protein [Deltaproteobacteria bacterium]|nr:Trm112 family protein [Deltaproteobacteria bacterium]
MSISPQLLKILACPRCLNGVRLNKTGDGLICNTCHLVYEIKDNIPIMLISEARKAG